MTIPELLNQICTKYPSVEAHRAQLQGALQHVVSHLPPDMTEDQYLTTAATLLTIPDLPPDQQVAALESLSKFTA